MDLHTFDAGCPICDGRCEIPPKQKALLRNWFQCGTHLHGIIEGHPRLGNGTCIRTSTVVRINRDRGVAETLNTCYRLEDEQAEEGKCFL